MQGTIQSDLIRGHINTIILKALFEGDRYGYDIIKEIEQKSGGQYILKQPTLYSCLKRLEVQGFVRAYWGAKTSGGRRKYFTLTENGRDLFIKNQSEWEYSRSVIDKLISDKEYDFSNIPLFTNGDYESAASVSEGGENTKSDENTDIESEFIDTSGDESDEKDAESGIMSDIAYDSKVNETEKSEPHAEEDAVFLDPAKILHELFSRQNDKMSYSGKIEGEQININNDAVASLTSDNYFKDYFNSEHEDESAPFIAESEKQQSYIEKNITNTFNSQSGSASAFDESEESGKDYFSGFTVQNEAKSSEEATQEFVFTKSGEDNQKTEKPEQKPAAYDFMSYDRTLNTNNKSDILDRAYKDVLATLVLTQFDSPRTQEDAVETAPMIPESEEIKKSGEIYSGAEQVQPPPAPRPDYSQFKDPLNNSLTKLTLDARNATGDNIKTRIHAIGTANEYSNTYHFYSNKLMLIHFAILFAIMMLELAVVFLFVKFLYPVIAPNTTYNNVTFILALILTVGLPLFAALMNFIEPNKIKRIEFSLKTSIIFRCIVAATLIMITYLVNLFLDMPLSTSSDYLATLLLPLLFSLDFIASGFIFYLLYSSGKFNKNY